MNPFERFYNEYSENILSWSDYQIETLFYKYVEWLYPNKNNTLAPIPNEKDMFVFQNNKSLRKKVVKITLRFLLFCGFYIDENYNIVQVKPIYRITNKGTITGLLSSGNYDIITRILQFLETINLGVLSSLFFLALCQSVKLNNAFKSKVKLLKVFPKWIETQKYLNRYDLNDSKFTNIKEPYFSWVNEIEPETKEEQNCFPFTGLDFVGNSCYQDSVLLALFALPIDIITQEIFDKQFVNKNICNENIYTAIQNELIEITKKMRKQEKNYTCSNLRKLLKYCKMSEKFYSTGMQDAGEFLIYLFSIFNVEPVKKERITLVSNNLDNNSNMVFVSKQIFNSSPIHIIHLNSDVNLEKTLLRTDDSILSNDNLYIDKKTNIKYKRRVEIERIISAPILIFYIQRHKKAIVNFEPYINNLKLHAIIVFQNHHYTCYISCNDIWYYHDDMETQIKHIGSFSDLKSSYPNPKTNGTLFFYIDSK